MSPPRRTTKQLRLSDKESVRGERRRRGLKELFENKSELFYLPYF